jgi:hypothetical protein
MSGTHGISASADQLQNQVARAINDKVTADPMKNIFRIATPSSLFPFGFSFTPLNERGRVQDHGRVLVCVYTVVSEDGIFDG